jgi:hypothetical protein
VSIATVTDPLEQTVFLIFARMMALLPPESGCAVTVRVGAPPETVTTDGSEDSNVTGAEGGSTVTFTWAEPPTQTPFARFGPNVIVTGVPLHTPFSHLSSTVQSFPSSHGTVRKTGLKVAQWQASPGSSTIQVIQAVLAGIDGQGVGFGGLQQGCC